MMTFILLANVNLVFLYLFYRVFLKGTTFFQWKRGYLLSMPMVAYGIAGLVVSNVLQSSVSQDGEGIFFAGQMIPMMNIEVVGMGSDVSGGGFSLEALVQFFNSVVPDLAMLYWLGFMLSMGWFLLRLFNSFKIFNTPCYDIAYSFFNRIVVNSTAEQYDVLYNHEKIHAEQGHTFDLIWMELNLVANWFNPVVYFMRTELKLQHEFIADEVAAQNDKVSYAELLLAQSMGVTSSLLINKFNNPSHLKSRIMMLFKNKTAKGQLVKLFGVVPMVIVLIVLSSSINSFSSEQQKKVASQSVKDQIDTIKGGKSEIVDFSKIEIQPKPDNEHYRTITEFRMWVAQNFAFPEAAVDAKLNDIVEAKFVIEIDGRLSNVEIVRDPGYGLGDALKKVLENSYSWLPGIQDGKPVRTAFTLPIRVNTTVK
jgi:hypothetical protein